MSVIADWCPSTAVERTPERVMGGRHRLVIKVEAPKLSGLRKHSLHFTAHRIFRSVGPKSYAQLALVTNFLRLADLAVHDYEEGRKLVIKYFEAHQSLALDRLTLACGHFESCMSSIKRAVAFLKAIRSSKELPQEVKALFPRGLLLLRSDVEKRLHRMRHRVQHLEGAILRGELKEGQPFSMLTDHSGVELGDQRISYSDLAEWLNELHSCASGLLNYYTKAEE